MVKIAQKNVDINLQATEGKNTKQALDNIIDKLKEVKELSQFNLGIDSKKIKEAEQGIKSIQDAKKESEKSDKIQLEITKLQQKEVQALSKGWEKSLITIREYISQLQNGEEITSQQYADLKLIQEKEKAMFSEKIQGIKHTDKAQQEANKKQLKMQEQQKKSLKDTLESQRKMIALMQIKSGSGSGYEKLNTELDKYNQSVKNGIPLTQKQINDLRILEAETKKNVTSTNSLADATKAMGGIYAGITLLQKAYIKGMEQIRELSELEEPIYNLGVVSGKTGAEISQLRTEMLDMASEVPQTASEIANALDLIVRTGTEYRDALTIIDASNILATASGEKLSFISEILAKSLVAFSLEADVASGKTDRFQSTVLNTPLSMEGLSNAMKNSSSAFATVINFTTKTNESLDEYKSNLLDLSAAMTGQFAKQGKVYALYKPFFMLGVPKVA